MKPELELRRKMTLRSGERKLVVRKNALESIEHVLMKAFIWHLYLPEYPDALVEYRIGDRYRPDVVALDGHGEPIFWGEAGSVTTAKIDSLIRRFPRTHLAIGKWDTRIDPWIDIVRELLVARPNRTAPIDLIRFSERHVTEAIDARGVIHLGFDDVECVRLDPDTIASHG